MRRLTLLAAIVATALASPAAAALKVGAKAPDFTTTGYLGGKPFAFHLADALKQGPVVLYFFPSAYTSGCTIEANQFAEAAADFRKAGATLIGVTAGQTDRLAAFSKEHCRDKFPVAPVTMQTIKAYDSALMLRPGWSGRDSYVIGRDGRVVFVHSDLNPVKHVQLTLAAVRKLDR